MANEIIDEILFNGGLDTDSDDKFVQQGDYVDALNIAKVEDGDEGIVVNIKGNKSVYTKDVANLAEYLCGWTVYNKNETIVLFLYTTKSISPFTFNKIVEFNPQTEASTVIVNDLLLGFSNPSTNDYYIDADMIDDWLSWTDNESEPKTINVQTIKDDSPTITASYLSAIKKPPFYVPVVEFDYDSAIDESNIVGSLYKFKYRYTYNGYRKSVWSAASSVAVDPADMNLSENSKLSLVDNYIKLYFNSGDADVLFLEFSMQNSNIGNWQKILILDKTNPIDIYEVGGTPASSISNNTIYYYKFYNDSLYAIVDSAEILKPYDNVPKLSECLSYISDNRLIYGGNTIGNDVDDITIDISFTPVYNLKAPQVSFTGTYSYVNAGGNCTVKAVFDLSAILPLGAKAGDIIFFNFYYGVAGAGTIRLNSLVNFPYDAASVSDKFDYIEEIIKNIITDGADSDSITLVGNNIEFAATWNGTSGTSGGTPFETSVYIVTKEEYSSFKLGVNKQFGIVYFDDYGRKSPVLVGDGGNVQFADFNDGETGVVDVDYTISHDAPTWAAYYRFAYVRNAINFVTTFAYRDSYVYDENGDIEMGLVAIHLTPISGIENYSSKLLNEFNIEIGDKIQPFITATTVSNTVLLPDTKYTINDIKTNVYDSLGASIKGYFLIVNPENWTEGDDNLSTVSILDSFLVRISKDQKLTSDNIFYEVGDIGLCNSVITGDHIPASGTITDGDVWVKYTAFLEDEDVYGSNEVYDLVSIENYIPSENIGDSLFNADLPNIKDENFREQYTNTIYWTKKYFQDTQINGLNSVDLISIGGVIPRKDVSDSYGKIKGLEELGDSIVVVCEEKILSGYVGATEYTDVQGNVNVVKSTIPIGYLRPHREKYGTFLKESILNTGKYIYFYDLFNGVVVRKSANGLFPISGRIDTVQGAYSYKMRSYFRALSDSLIDSLYVNENYYDVKCYMGFDPYHENVYITFKDNETAANNVSLVFSETTNKWITKYTSYVAGESSTLYPFTKNNLYSYYGNSLYKLNDSSVDRCKLYGVQQESYIQFVSHSIPNIIKVFNSIGIHADSQWTAELIEGDVNSNYNFGFYSKIPDANFVRDEGVWRSEFLRNMKTRSSTATNYDLNNGEECRNYVVKIKLTNDETTKTELFKVDISSMVSK